MNLKNKISIGVIFTCLAGLLICNHLTKEKGTAVHLNDGFEQNSLFANYNIDKKNEQTIILGDTYQEQDVTGSVDNNVQSDEISEQTEEEKQKEKEEVLKNRKKEAIEAISTASNNLSVSAKSALLMNSENKMVLYSKNGLDEIQPASTAKLLTAIVAVELSDEEEQFVVGSEIKLIAPDSSRAYLIKGQILSLNQILDALLLPSGNDAAYVIAANLGRKIAGDTSLGGKTAVNFFIEKMNDKAYEIGVVNSHFCSPDGYDSEGQYTTAFDLALIASEALNHEIIREVVQKEKARDILLSGHDVTWYNTNKLIKPGSGFYYKYAIGLKTGSSGEAGRCLISAAKKGEKEYVSVVMDASLEGRWQDSIDLLSYAIERE